MKEIDRLLAAPDTTAKNETERCKYEQRKAQEVARAAQLAAEKLTELPTTEDLLADIIRVADDRTTNPFWRFRSISRRRYELYGHFPVSAVDRQFGQFTHALEVAGLRDQPGTRLWKANRARQSREEHAARYLQRYVAPYVARQPEMVDHRYRMLSISDTHAMMMCPFTWLSFLSAVRDIRPDGVLVNGDAMDTVQLSKHPKVPGWTPSLQMELDFTRCMFREIRKVHEGDLFFTAGNHDLPTRLAMHLTQVDPALAGIDNLRVDQLLRLGEHDVQLFHGGSIVSPKGHEDEHTGFLMFGFYRVHHGTKLGQSPGLAELKAAGRSGQSGHVHRAALAFGTTEATEGMSWMCTPMGARHEVARWYDRGSTTTGWQRGFGYAELRADQSVHQYPCVVQRERVSCEGFTYERGDLPDPDPMSCWLESKKYQLGPESEVC